MNERDKIWRKFEELFKDKRYASEILYELEVMKKSEGKKLSKVEAHSFGYALQNWSVYSDHPLLKLFRSGYRYYENTKTWDCHFCRKTIGEREGYWAHKEMQWSQGPKMCHECFLKLVVLVESNSPLYELLSALKEVEKYPVVISKFEEGEFISLVKELASFETWRLRRLLWLIRDPKNLRKSMELTDDMLKLIKELLVVLDQFVRILEA